MSGKSYAIRLLRLISLSNLSGDVYGPREDLRDELELRRDLYPSKRISVSPKLQVHRVLSERKSMNKIVCFLKLLPSPLVVGSLRRVLRAFQYFWLRVTRMFY